jgi:hypothetical protein
MMIFIEFQCSIHNFSSTYVEMATIFIALMIAEAKATLRK